MPEDSNKLNHLRHSLAHVLASAVIEMFPKAHLGVGPVIENGFFYDFLLPRPLTPEDIKKIEKRMRDFIKQAPRSWREILVEYHGQPYPVIYRAFGNLRHSLGRLNQEPWFKYTFSESDFAPIPTAAPASNFDPRHTS